MKRKNVIKDQTHFLRVMIKAAKLRYEKFKAYGDSYKSFGVHGLVFRLKDKIDRSINLIKGVDSTTLKEESLTDTLIDIANYAIMTVMVIEQAKEEGIPQQEFEILPSFDEIFHNVYYQSHRELVIDEINDLENKEG